MRVSTSITQLTLLGFLLVVLPLTIAVISTVRQVDGLAAHMQRTVHESTQAVEASRMIQTLVLNLGRSAGQYRVLRDAAILSRYQDQRQKLSKAIGQLQALSPDSELSQRLKRLQQLEHKLHLRLEALPDSRPENQPKLLEIHLLSDLLHPLTFEVSLMVSEMSNAINAQVTQVRHQLIWQALAVIPLAIFLAVVFSVLITRPLRHLGGAILRLGGGEFSTQIEVSGPQDIRELGRRLDWLRLRLAELDEQKLIFLQHVSHELKTPLTAIREAAELLRDQVVGPLNNEQAEVTQILRDNSLQLQSQVEALLNFNSALAQERPPHSVSVELDQLLQEMVQNQHPAVRGRGIRIISELEPVTIQGDREQLQVLLGNLLSNATKFSPDSAIIELKLWTRNEQAVVDIIDFGPGIDAEEQMRIFEPFYQGQPPSRSYVKGTGLGLSIARRIAHLHAGKLELLPSDRGAHFRLILPFEGCK